MAPFADTLNHVTGQNNARLFYEKSSLQVCLFEVAMLRLPQMIAIADIAAGQEVLFKTVAIINDTDYRYTTPTGN